MREKILEIAGNYFTRYGIKSVTMDDLSKYMGISKKTLYQFFENKDTLVKTVFEIHLSKEHKDIVDIAVLAKDAIDEMIIMTKFSLAQFRKVNPAAVYDLQKYYRELWSAIEDYQNTYAFEAIKRNIVTGIEQGLYRSDTAIEIIAKMYVSFTTIVIDEDKFPSSLFNKEKVIIEFVKYHIRAIATPKGLALLDKYEADLH